MHVGREARLPYPRPGDAVVETVDRLHSQRWWCHGGYDAGGACCHLRYYLYFIDIHHHNAGGACDDR